MKQLMNGKNQSAKFFGIQPQADTMLSKSNYQMREPKSEFYECTMSIAVFLASEVSNRRNGG